MQQVEQTRTESVQDLIHTKNLNQRRVWNWKSYQNYEGQRPQLDTLSWYFTWARDYFLASFDSLGLLIFQISKQSTCTQTLLFSLCWQFHLILLSRYTIWWHWRRTLILRGTTDVSKYVQQVKNQKSKRSTGLIKLEPYIFGVLIFSSFKARPLEVSRKCSRKLRIFSPAVIISQYPVVHIKSPNFLLKHVFEKKRLTNILQVPMVYIAKDSVKADPKAKRSSSNSKLPLLDFLRHQVSDIENFSLQKTDGMRLSGTTKVCCAWFNRSNNWTPSAPQEKQRREQEEERLKKERLVLLSELDEDNRNKLAETSLAALELSEDVLDPSQRRCLNLKHTGKILDLRDWL